MELAKQITGGHVTFPKQYWEGISTEGNLNLFIHHWFYNNIQTVTNLLYPCINHTQW